MPVPMIRRDLNAGRLVKLDLPDFKGGAYRVFAKHRTNRPPGPSATFLIERFARHVRDWAPAYSDVEPL